MLGPFQTTGLARRLIPCLDVSGGRVVKGVRFEHLRDAGDPVEQAARYDADGADELVRPVRVVARRLLHGVPGVPQMLETHALHDPPPAHVQAGDQPPGEARCLERA